MFGVQEVKGQRHMTHDQLLSISVFACSNFTSEDRLQVVACVRIASQTPTAPTLDMAL